MSLSYRYAAARQAGAYTWSVGGLGVRGGDIPATGLHGPAIQYPGLVLPAEANDEFMYRVVTAPPLLTLFRYDAYGRVQAEGPDGAHEGVYEGRKNGVVYGSAPFYVLIGVGGSVSGGVTTDPAVASGSFSAAADTQVPTLTGTISITSLTDTGFIATCQVATDNVAVVGYQHRLDGGAWFDIAGGGRSTTYSGLVPESTHTLDMRAKDAVPNFSAPLSTPVTLEAAGALPPPSTATPEDTLKAPQDQILVVGGFAPKDPRQVKTLAFDFRRYAGSVINPVLTVVRERGAADASPGTMLYGAASVVGSMVYQRVRNGVPLCDYTVYCEVDTPNGEHLVMAGRLPVRLVPLV